MLVGFTTLSVVASWFINKTFMGSYYIESKTTDLIEAYQSVNKILEQEDSYLTYTQKKELASKFETEGISALVVDSDLSVTFSSGFGITNELLLTRLKDILFNNTTSGEVIKNEEHYVVQKIYEEDSKREYIEMCGQIGQDNEFFIMRSSLESISGVVETANQFYLRVGLLIIGLGTVAIFPGSRLIHLIEFNPDFIQIFLWNMISCIIYVHTHDFFFFFQENPDFFCKAQMMNCVTDIICQYFLYLEFIRPHIELRLVVKKYFCILFLKQYIGLIQHFVNQRNDIKPFHLHIIIPKFNLIECQQFLYHLIHFGRFIYNHITVKIPAFRIIIQIGRAHV